MFIASRLIELGAPEERNVLWYVVYMPLLTERHVWVMPSYKHIAPLEQDLE